MYEKIERKNKMKKKELEKMKEECWNLDLALVEWLNEHLKFFKEEVNGIINLSKLFTDSLILFS